MEKYKVHATIDYAGFWIRLVAFLIDALILAVSIWVYWGLLSMAFGLGWMGIGGSVDLHTTDIDVGGAYGVLTVLIPSLMVIAYSICFWGWRGQTPGKMVLRLKITRIDGSDIDWSAAILRFLGYIISSLLVGIGFLWIANDNYRQGFHDKVADTYVIRLPRQ